MTGQKMEGLIVNTRSVPGTHLHTCNNTVYTDRLGTHMPYIGTAGTGPHTNAHPSC